MSNNQEKVKRVSNITLRVGLDEQNVPVYMDWQSEDSPDTPQPEEAKAFLLSIFDKEHKDTFKIDLWTEEMQVVEMDRFMFQTLKSLADTYYRATKNDKLANQMQGFAQYFGQETGFVPKEEK